MKNSKAGQKDFKTALKKYLDIKGLDIVLVMDDGTEIELSKNRELVDDVIVCMERGREKTRIPLTRIKSADFFAA